MFKRKKNKGKEQVVEKEKGVLSPDKKQVESNGRSDKSPSVSPKKVPKSPVTPQTKSKMFNHNI